MHEYKYVKLIKILINYKNSYDFLSATEYHSDEDYNSRQVGVVVVVVVVVVTDFKK